MVILRSELCRKMSKMKGVTKMNSEYESSTCIADNLYAFLGWVVSYSDYGKEIAVDTILKRFKLLDKIDESMSFDSKEEYAEYSMLVKEYSNDLIDDEEIVSLTEDEVKRCEELKKEFTPRFKRAKQFTVEQVAEYKVRRLLNKEGTVVLTESIQPVKLIDHEKKKIISVFYSPEYASKVLRANKKRIKDAAERRTFYKGYIWDYCSTELYEKYNEKLNKNGNEMSKKVEKSIEK